MKTGNLSRRRFMRTAALVTTGAVLAACQPKVVKEIVKETVEVEKIVKETVIVEGTPQVVEKVVKEVVTATTAPKAPAEGVTVQYWVGWGNYAGWWPQMEETDEFKEAIDGNTLEIKGSIGEALLPALAAGTPPDGVSNVGYLDMMARDVLWPIDEAVNTSTIIKKERFLEGSWKDAFYKGTMYGIPANEGFVRYGLDYNSELVAAAGLDPEQPPETWSELLEWHKALTKFDSAGNLKQIGLDPYDAMGGSIHIANGFFAAVSWGWQWFDADTGTFDLDNDKMIEAFDVMGQFYKIAGPDQMAGMRQVEGQGGWGGSFNTEVQAMMIEGYWHPGETMIEKPEVGKYNVASWAPVPDSRKGVKVQGTGGHYLLIFKDAKYKEEMFKIGEFLNTDKACELIFKNVGWLPSLKTFIETIDPGAYPGLDFYFKSVKEATEWSTPARCEITDFVQTQYSELREKVYRDQMTAKEAAAEFQKRCESEYKQAGFAG